MQPSTFAPLPRPRTGFWPVPISRPQTRFLTLLLHLTLDQLPNHIQACWRCSRTPHFTQLLFPTLQTQDPGPWPFPCLPFFLLVDQNAMHISARAESYRTQVSRETSVLWFSDLSLTLLSLASILDRLLTWTSPRKIWQIALGCHFFFFY